MSKDKYDRQTRWEYFKLINYRLWGEGQILICHSRILCFNADGAATETLKNLTLAGAGYITIVDNKEIDEQDLHQNFFLNRNDVGKNRAEISLSNLIELNPDDVQGKFYASSPEEFLANNLLELQTYDIVISSNNQDVKIFCNV